MYYNTSPNFTFKISLRMNYLRSKLKEIDLKLFEILERSWEIAFEEWLPAFGAKNDSYNSYPHLRNIERYLDRIFEENESNEVLSSFTGIEFYILLSSILFHDIGKIESSINHASKSEEIIKNRRAELGIINDEIALIIGKICKFHDPPKNDKADINFHTITIDPYGEVREGILGTLLRLADNLDSAYTRVLPTYIKGANEFKIIGAFRKLISGVSIVSKAQYVKTVIGKEDSKEKKAENEQKDKNQENLSEIEFSINTASEYWSNEDKYHKYISILSKLEAFINLIKEKDTSKSFFEEVLEIKLEISDLSVNNQFGFQGIFKTSEKIWKDYNSSNKNDDLSVELVKLKNKLSEKFSQNKIKMGDYSLFENYKVNGSSSDKVLLDAVYNDLINTNKTDPNKEWPNEILLTIILKDIKRNQRTLFALNNELTSMEFPLKAWLVEYEDNLYNISGGLTYEPLFTIEYLKEIVDGMWQLSSRIFGSSIFTYLDLAAQVRDPNVYKIKLAVKRISIVTNTIAPVINTKIQKENQGVGEEKQKKYFKEKTIWYSSTHWQWLVLENLHNSKEMVYDMIKELDKPYINIIN